MWGQPSDFGPAPDPVERGKEGRLGGGRFRLGAILKNKADWVSLSLGGLQRGSISLSAPLFCSVFVRPQHEYGCGLQGTESEAMVNCTPHCGRSV